MIIKLQKKVRNIKWKGFTIVELLGVIAIMAIILLMAVPIYGVISTNIKENLYTTKVNNILAKSETYVEEKEISVFMVKDLITSGNLEADNELGQYLDPRNNRDMSCDIINVIYENYNYHASITENMDCAIDQTTLENLYGVASLYLVKAGTNERIELTEENAWTSEEAVEVMYELDEDYQIYADKIEKIVWSGEQEKHYSQINLSEGARYSIEPTPTIKTVTVRLKITFNINGTIVESISTLPVRLDRQKPFIIGNSMEYSNEEYTGKGRKVTFELSDGAGSGVKEFALVNTPDCSTEAEYQSASDGLQTVYLWNGTYYICVKDRAGNLNLEEDLKNPTNIITVQNTDNVKPVLVLTGGSNEWRDKAVLNWTATDEGSGIYLYQYSLDGTNWSNIFVNTLTINNQYNGYYYVKAMDRVGNWSNVEKAQVKVDKTKPIQAFTFDTRTEGTNSWYHELKIKVTAKDDHSGPASAKYCITSETSCTPDTVVTLNSNNNFVITMPENKKAQRVCAQVTDKVGNISTITCSNAYKVDTTNPTHNFSINSYQKSSGSDWYKSLSIKASFGDSISGISSAKYCITISSSCIPATTANLVNNSFTVDLESNASAQKVCVQTTDIAGRTNSTTCTNAYLVDTVTPTAKINVSVSGSSATIDASGSTDAHSKIKTYYYSKDGTNYESSSDSTFTFTNLTGLKTYTFYVKVEDNARRVSSAVKKSATISVDAAKYVTSLSGNGQVISDDPDSNPRYYGASPNNYIDIGDRDADGNIILWRIIGVFNVEDENGNTAKRLKVIRNDGLGDISWDASKWLASPNNYKINIGYGVNEWSQADLMMVMNPGFEDNTETRYYGDYNGKVETMNNSLYWNRQKGNCSVSWGVQVDSCDFTSNGLSDDAKNLIGQSVWNTGTNGSTPVHPAASAVTMKDFYDFERSSDNGKICNYPGVKGSCNDTIPRTTTWTGYIGLMYPSDYGYATSGGSSISRTACVNSQNALKWSSQCYNNDWLFFEKDKWQWTLFPVSDAQSNNRAYLCAYINYSQSSYTPGSITQDDCMRGVDDMAEDRTGNVRPTAYLIANLRFTSGSGTASKPYVASK